MGKETKNPHENIHEEAEKPLKSKNWRENLKNLDINIENFQSETILLVESSPECFDITDALRSEIEDTEQSRIRSITSNDITKMVNEEVTFKHLGELSSLLKKAVAEAKKEIMVNNIISSELLSLLIKLRILIIRNEYLRHKESYYELQRNLEMEQQNFLTFTEEKPEKKRKGKDKKGKKTDKTSKKKSNKNSKSGTSSKKGKKNKKENTEDICDKINKISDDPSSTVKSKIKMLDHSKDFIEPFEGTDLYFVINQIYDYDIINELNAIHVNLSGLIDFARNEYDFSTEIYHITPFETSSEQQIRSIDISNFWRALGIDGRPLISFPKTMCYIRYLPYSEENSYNDLVNISYNITALKRLHNNYINSMNVLDVVEEKPPVRLRNMSVYNKILSRVPNELQSVPVVLHALIEEMACRQKLGTNPEEQYKLHEEPPPKPSKRHKGIKGQMLELLQKIDEKQPLKTMPSTVTLCKPIQVQYGNVLNYKHGLNVYGEDLLDINIKALKIIEPLKLFDFYPLAPPEKTLTYNYVFHKWASDFEYTPINRLRHCIHAFYMSCGKFFTPFPQQTIQTKTIEDLFFSDIKPFIEQPTQSKIYTAYLLSNIWKDLHKKLLIKPTKVINEQSYCEHYEEYTPETMVQMVNVAYEDIGYYEYKFLGPHDVLLLKFKPGCSLENYDYYNIRTPLCFRDFCGYVVNTETDWIYKQEEQYWENKQKKKEEPLENIDNVYEVKEEDFILPGSIKDRLRQEKMEEVHGKKGKKGGKGKGDKDSKGKGDKSSKGKGDKGSKGKGDKGSKGKGDKGSKGKKAKSDTKKGKEKKKTSKTSSKSSKTTPEIQENVVEETIEKITEKSFEGYDLHDSYFALRTSKREYYSGNGIKVSMEKYLFTENIEKATVKISINDNLLLFHGKLTPGMKIKPFVFHIHLSNGVILGFGPPRLPKQITPPTNKCIATYEISKPKTKTTPKASNYKNHNELLSELETPEFHKKKQDILEKIKQAVEYQLPVFKIISSPLHKHQYVKRIKSHVNIPVEKVIKRLVYKPKLPKPPKRQFLVSQCLPVTHLDDNTSHCLNYDFKASLPTGLCVQTVPGIDDTPFYIRQGYIIDRNDLTSIEHEDYRCFLKGTVVCFLKTGEVLTMSLDRVLERRQYGYFSSNVRKLEGKPKKRNGYVVHKALKNITRMEKKIRGMYKKYMGHMIDLSENYRMASKRECLRDEKKKYKLSKKLYRSVPSHLPLLKMVTVTEDGSKVVRNVDSVVVEKKKYVSMVYNNYAKRECLIYRQDGTLWFLGSEGHATTQFKDGTRITTWPVLIDETFTDEDTFQEDYYKETTNNNELDDFIKYYEIIGETEEEYARSEEAIEPFVLYGLNYKYEHPNYMTVTEHDESTFISMPDDVKIKIANNGKFTISLQKQETIHLSHNSMIIRAKICNQCNSFNDLKVNIKPFYKKNHRNTKDTFIKMKDTQNKIICIDFQGNSIENESKDDSMCSMCVCVKPVADRFFVLRRDLSGAELFIRPSESRFIYTLNKIEMDIKYNPIDENNICLLQQLYKTYSEQLMMLYDTPILGMVENASDLEELYHSFDFDQNSIISLRTPVFIYERNIYHLYFYKIIESLFSGFHKILTGGKKYQTLEPSSLLAKFIQEHSPVVETPITQPGTPLLKKRQSPKNVKDRLKLLNLPIPKYFECLRGLMVSNIIECSENAMKISDGELAPGVKRSIYKEVHEKASNLLPNETLEELHLSEVQSATYDLENAPSTPRLSIQGEESFIEIFSRMSSSHKTIQKKDSTSTLRTSISKKKPIPSKTTSELVFPTKISVKSLKRSNSIIDYYSTCGSLSKPCGIRNKVSATSSIGKTSVYNDATGGLLSKTGVSGNGQGEMLRKSSLVDSVTYSKRSSVISGDLKDLKTKKQSSRNVDTTSSVLDTWKTSNLGNGQGEMVHPKSSLLDSRTFAKRHNVISGDLEDTKVKRRPSRNSNTTSSVLDTSKTDNLGDGQGEMVHSMSSLLDSETFAKRYNVISGDLEDTKAKKIPSRNIDTTTGVLEACKTGDLGNGQGEMVHSKSSLLDSETFAKRYNVISGDLEDTKAKKTSSRNIDTSTGILETRKPSDLGNGQMVNRKSIDSETFSKRSYDISGDFEDTKANEQREMVNQKTIDSETFFKRPYAICGDFEDTKAKKRPSWNADNISGVLETWQTSDLGNGQRVNRKSLDSEMFSQRSVISGDVLVTKRSPNRSTYVSSTKRSCPSQSCSAICNINVRSKLKTYINVKSLTPVSKTPSSPIISIEMLPNSRNTFEKKIATSIINSIANELKVDVGNITDDDIRSILLENTGPLRISTDNAMNIVHEIENILFQDDPNADKNETYHTAMNIIRKVKEGVSEIEETSIGNRRVTDDIIEDMSHKASMMIYDVLEHMTPSVTQNISKGVQKMLREERLSKVEAQLVLDNTAKSIYEALHGPQIYSATTFETTLKIPFEVCVRIIQVAEKVLLNKMDETSSRTSSRHKFVDEKKDMVCNIKGRKSNKKCKKGKSITSGKKYEKKKSDFTTLSEARSIHSPKPSTSFYKNISEDLEVSIPTEKNSLKNEGKRFV